MKEGLISVIMSVYNEHSEWLIESIESITNQTYRNLEFIIIIDNPDNFELIEIVEKYKIKDNRIKYHVNNINRGLVFSLNYALGLCSGAYVARMDADDISLPERLDKQIKYLELNSLDLIGSNVTLFNDSCGDYFTTNKLLSQKYIEKLLFQGSIGIVHPTFFGKRELFDNLNGYSNSAHTEDKEFLARVLYNNYKIANMSDVLLRCRYSNESITKKNAFYVDLMGRYVTKVYRNSKLTNKYIFNENFLSTITIYKDDIRKFELSKKYLCSAREHFNNKRIYQFVLNIIKCVYYNYKSIDNLKINVYLLVFRFIEKRTL